MVNVQQVPLTIYVRGKRVECGMASVAENGEITAKVKKDLVEFVRGQFLGKALEISITPTNKPPFVPNTPTAVKQTVIIEEI